MKPEFVTATARALHRAMTAAYDPTAAEQALLIEALRALDRAEQARLAVGAQLTVATRGGEPKAHPLLLVERDARAAFARMLRQLGLDDPATPTKATSTSSFPRRRANR